MKKLEAPVLTAIVFALIALIVTEGRTRASLEATLPITPRGLYQQLGRSGTTVQIVDVRAGSEDFEDTHIPGAIPLPECDPAKASSAAADRVLESVPTVIVSDDGSAAAFARCSGRFTHARNLAGGLQAWVDENLPEDSGEYVAPKGSAGGGCL